MPLSLRTQSLAFTYDCPDALQLAEFYAALLGWPLTADSDTQWADLDAPEAAPFRLSFQQVTDYRRPTWPDVTVPQQAHLDLTVPSIPEATEIAVAAGATVHEVQPSETGSFLVLIDPAGHPFCLCAE